MPLSAQNILFISQLYTLVVYILLIVFGLVGNLFNVLTFRCFKLFRSHPCAFYLIVESIANATLMIIVLPFRITDFVFAYDPTRLSSAWCKLRHALVATSSLLSFSTVCFAAIDQYLSTNSYPRLRQLSTLKLAYRLSSLAGVTLVLYGIPFAVFYRIQPMSDCSIAHPAFLRFYSFVHLSVLSALLPIIVSSLFATLAYTNVRRIIRRQMPLVRQRLDRQLTSMVLTKVAFLVVNILPFDTYRIYLSNVSSSKHDPFRFAVEQLIFTITSSLFYVNSAVSHCCLGRTLQTHLYS